MEAKAKPPAPLPAAPPQRPSSASFYNSRDTLRIKLPLPSGGQRRPTAISDDGDGGTRERDEWPAGIEGRGDNKLKTRSGPNPVHLLEFDCKPVDISNLTAINFHESPHPHSSWDVVAKILSRPIPTDRLPLLLATMTVGECKSQGDRAQEIAYPLNNSGRRHRGVVAVVQIITI